MRAENFSSDEFRDWADDMSPRLITLLDVLRYRLGVPVIISPNPDSLGRNLGSESQSAHNVDMWGEVLAADFFVPDADPETAIKVMRWLGFTGIGLYTDTVYGGESEPMFHGDVRPTQDMGAPATWGRVKGKYTSLKAAIDDLKGDL